MGKIPKTQGFSQPCTKGIRTLCKVLMCSSGSGASTDVQGRKIRVNWGSVCYPTFCQKYNVWSVGIVLTNWLICIPPLPQHHHHQITIQKVTYVADVQYDLMESPCHLKLRSKLDIGISRSRFVCFVASRETCGV